MKNGFFMTEKFDFENLSAFNSANRYFMTS
jgi:hypothetical protein